MEYIEGKFKGQKKINLFYQCWLPTRKAKAILLVVHGVSEHSGRYTNLVNYFVRKNYAVYGFDHRGHGKSNGLGGYVERFQYYVNDLHTFYNLVRGEHSNPKIFLVGHSMGGLIAIAYAVDHQHELAGLLLSAPTLKLSSSRSPVLIAVGRVFSMLLPKMGATLPDASAISQDQTVVDTAISDPLAYKGKISVRLGVELIQAMQKVTSQISWIHLPILIMHGTADRLNDPAGSQMLYERVTSKDKTLKFYEGFYHEIFSEPGRQQVFADMKAWLAAHI